MMKPVVALVGRPNVGKSTLFNRLTGTRRALVHNRPGVTRDRMYGMAEYRQQPFYVVDTGGLDEESELGEKVLSQVETVVRECSVVVFVVDGRDGLSHADEAIAQRLRRLDVPTIVTVNKTEGYQGAAVSAEFHQLGLGAPVAVSALRGRGVDQLMTQVWSKARQGAPEEPEVPDYAEDLPQVAVLGRPNVGKSTLINSLAGESRLVVSDVPGTTRDSVDVIVERNDQRYVIVDTAGIRRRARTRDDLEKLTVVRSLKSLEKSNVVIVVLDSHEGVMEQDATIAGLVEDSGRSAVVAMNKWDGLHRNDRNQIRREVIRKLPFFKHLSFIPVSALHGSGLGELMHEVHAAWQSSMVQFNTSDLNRRFKEATESLSPPLHQGRAVRLKYVHQGARNPPTVIVHGNQTDYVPESYRRYLSNFFTRSYRLAGTRVRIDFRNSKNPYSD